MPAKNLENNKMKTRSLERLESNGTTLDNSIPTNEQPKPNIDDILETALYEPIDHLQKIYSRAYHNLLVPCFHSMST